jgi:hypothetical protein
MGVTCDAATGVSVKFYGKSGCQGTASSETATKVCDAVTSYGTTTVITASCGSSSESAATPNVAAIVVPIVVGLLLISGGIFYYVKVYKAAPKPVLTTEAPAEPKFSSA